MGSGTIRCDLLELEQPCGKSEALCRWALTGPPPGYLWTAVSFWIPLIKMYNSQLLWHHVCLDNAMPLTTIMYKNSEIVSKPQLNAL